MTLAQKAASMHRSISRSILDEVEDVAQEPLTPTEEPFTPTLIDFDREQECTTTEPDLSMTEVDSQSEASVESDSLLKLAQKSPKMSKTADPVASLSAGLPAHPSDQQDEKVTRSADHQCITGIPVHWSLEERFQQNVDIQLKKCTSEPWFDNQINFAHLVDFERSLQWATDLINENYRDWFKFKIGITENPYRRWHDSSFGYKKQNTGIPVYTGSPKAPIQGDYLAVIYTSPTSKRNVKAYDSAKVRELRQSSTGMMETLLINIFAELPNCINRKNAGADCPSEGSPHFCYVVASYSVDIE